MSKPFYDKVKENAEREDWDHYEIASGHECMVSHPDELARILLAQV